MSSRFSAAELLAAYRVLFGAQVGAALLESLREAVVKKAFRRRALETHPDRARTAGLEAGAMTRRFQEVSAAYELLCSYLEARKRGVVLVSAATAPAAGAPSAPRPKARGRDARGTDHFWGGGVPDRRLMLGQYLYYSRRISWQALIGAINWQRLQRPHFGQMAERWGFLTAELVSVVLQHRRLDERIGDTAVRLAMLSAYQRDAIIGLQRQAQRPLGDYFVQAGLLSRNELLAMVTELKQHNVVCHARAA